MPGIGSLFSGPKRMLTSILVFIVVLVIISSITAAVTPKSPLVMRAVLPRSARRPARRKQKFATNIAELKSVPDYKYMQHNTNNAQKVLSSADQQSDSTLAYNLQMKLQQQSLTPTDPRINFASGNSVYDDMVSSE
jgi:hypothetical protein